MGKISKSQSCLHFALQQEEEEEEQSNDDVTFNFHTRSTALQLPCGSALQLPVSSLWKESSPSTSTSAPAAPAAAPAAPAAPAAAAADVFDLYLQSHPILAARAQALHRSSSHISLAERMKQGSSGSATTLYLNVLQGEVAHATDQQAHVLWSGDATTCHVLAVRSTATTSTTGTSIGNAIGNKTSSTTSTSTRPLTTLAHLDDCHPICMETIVQEHLSHHNHTTATGEEDPTTGTSTQQSSNNNHKGTSIGNNENHHDDDDDNDDDFGFFDTAQDETDSPPALPALSFLQDPPNWIPATSTSPTDTTQFPGFVPPIRPTTTATTPSTTNIQMELHLVGGCNDPDGTSHQLSKDILETWAMLADKYSSSIQITLSTAAISGLNTTSSTAAAAAVDAHVNTRNDNSNNNNSIQARGMGIDTRTGDVFSIVDSKGVPDYLQGPALEIRQARLWARAIQEANNNNSKNHNHNQQQSQEQIQQPERPRLSVIHTRHNSELIIEPFDYQPHPHLETLLGKDDTILKQVTSTSPDLEGEQFCTSLRRTLSFLQRVPSYHVFPPSEEQQEGPSDDSNTTTSTSCHRPRLWKPKPLVYARSTGNLHQWEQVIDTTTTNNNKQHTTLPTTTTTTLPTTHSMDCLFDYGDGGGISF